MKRDLKDVPLPRTKHFKRALAIKVKLSGTTFLAIKWDDLTVLSN